MKSTTILFVGFGVVIAALAYIALTIRKAVSPEAPAATGDTEIGPARGVDAVEAALGGVSHQLIAILNNETMQNVTGAEILEGVATANTGITAVGIQAAANAARNEAMQNVIWQNQQAIAGVNSSKVIGNDGNFYYIITPTTPAPGTPGWAASNDGRERTIASQIPGGV